MKFVWLVGMKEDFPQLWYTEPKDGNGKPKYTKEQILFEKELDSFDTGLTLDELASKYPKP